MTTNLTSIATAIRTHLLPTGTMATPLVGVAFFDPIDLLMDKMGHSPTLYSRVMDSMAWMLDASCINQARTTLFARYKTQEIEDCMNFKDFCQQVAEDISHDTLYEGDESNELTLATLLALREHWHDAAASAAAADDHDYKCKSLRQQLDEEKPQSASVDVRANFKAYAAIEAEGNTVLADELYAAMVAQDVIVAQSRAQSNKELIPVILEVLRAAQHHAPSSARFDHLPSTVQRRLTQFAIGAIERTVKDLTKKLAKQPLAFARAVVIAKATTVALSAVIKAKFSEAAELENVTSQTAIDIGRNAKRVACSID